MRVALCSSQIGRFGTDGHLAEILLPHLRVAGLEVTHFVAPPTKLIDVDWWLVLDYITNLNMWLTADRGGAKIAYIEGTEADGVDLSLPWRQDKPNPLAPFCFLEEQFRGGSPQKTDIILVDHIWPGFAAKKQDFTSEIIRALGPLPNLKVAFTHELAPTSASDEWVILPRLPRPAFIKLLSKAKAFVQTHVESYGAVIREASFLGCQCYVHPAFNEPGICTLGGVIPYNDPNELAALLAQPGVTFDSIVGSVETAAREIASRLRAFG